MREEVAPCSFLSIAWAMNSFVVSAHRTLFALRGISSGANARAVRDYTLGKSIL